MNTLYHRCSQPLDVAEKLDVSLGRNSFAFLDVQTGDGYDRCPRCDRDLLIQDFTVQPAHVVSRAKRASVSPAKRQARALISKAREIAGRRVAA